MLRTLRSSLCLLVRFDELEGLVLGYITRQCGMITRSADQKAGADVASEIARAFSTTQLDGIARAAEKDGYPARRNLLKSPTTRLAHDSEPTLTQHCTLPLEGLSTDATNVSALMNSQPL